jgi:serine/threonine protein kinase
VCTELAPYGDISTHVRIHGGLSGALVCRYVLDLVEVLEYLHVEAGVLHGDLKLSNICIGEDGRVRLVDYGSASRVSEVYRGERTSVSVLSAGYRVGLDRYTAASECYALGVCISGMSGGGGGGAVCGLADWLLSGAAVSVSEIKSHECYKACALAAATSSSSLLELIDCDLGSLLWSLEQEEDH